MIAGTQKDTYLEFDRVLRIKKASSFGIEFKTTEKDGIIFYIADERNVDFIALLIKDGKVGSGSSGRVSDYFRGPGFESHCVLRLSVLLHLPKL